MVVVFIYFDEYNYHDSLQARFIDKGKFIYMTREDKILRGGLGGGSDNLYTSTKKQEISGGGVELLKN